MPSLVLVSDPQKQVMNKLKEVDEAGYYDLFRLGITAQEFENEKAVHNTTFNSPTRTVKQKKYWSLSELDTECDFSLYGKWLTSEYPPIDPASKEDRILWDAAAVNGKILHTHIQNALLKAGLVKSRIENNQVTSEHWLSDVLKSDKKSLWWDLKLTGRAGDGLFTDFAQLYIDSDLFLQETKGIPNDAFDPDGKYFMSRFKPVQSQLTLFFTGATKMRYFAINRDKFIAGTSPADEQCLEFDMYLDMPFVEGVLRRIKYLNEAIEKKQVPKASPPSCMLCSILPYCKTGQTYMDKRAIKLAKQQAVS